MTQNTSKHEIEGVPSSCKSPDAGSISELIHASCIQQTDAASLLAPGLQPLSYQELAAQMEYVGRSMRSLGIERSDRVAVVLPNGPDMAAAFLGVAAYAACAPLNPKYRQEEFEYYLKDLRAKAVLLPAGAETAARNVARHLGLIVVDVTGSDEQAGQFHLENVSGEPIDEVVPNGVEDVAMLLHTSGTTTRPKLVPLSHQNLCASAGNIASTLKLTCQDRCLNVMPLFHIHGLVGGLLSSLATGASVVCSPGYDRAAFPDWMNGFEPTWYTAVPTIHQVVLAQSRLDGPPASNHLRFIRSSSSALPPSVMEELEETFGVPVIESYGMTEATHQMASNPLPPAVRKPGSVGLPAGPQMAIMDENGELMDRGQTGEIVIRGPGVTKGYVDNPEANATAFVDGWFLTGDRGRMDEDGYLIITGRTKEMINRGGENISPREIDEVLLEHEGVAQAVAFAVPHQSLGEDLVAAVVTSGDTPPGERQLREYAMTRLADFKVPSQIVFVSEIPKGPTGKLQRIGLHEKLSNLLRREFVPAQTPTEQSLTEIWQKVVDCERIGIHDNFFRLGGDSLMATRLMLTIQEVLDVELPLHCLVETPTIAGLAMAVDEHDDAAQAASGASLKPIQSGTESRRPFFLVPGGGGGEDEFRIYAQLIHRLGRDQPVYGLYARGLDGQQAPHADVESMASDYVREIRTIQPQGPFLLGGECIGGIVALEMARQLQSHGESVAFLCLMNTDLPGRFRSLGTRLRRRATEVLQVNRFKYHWTELRQRSLAQKVRYICDHARGSVRNAFAGGKHDDRSARHIQHVQSCYQAIVRCHEPRAYEGRITLLVSEDCCGNNPTMKWGRIAVGGLDLHQVSGDRYSYLGEHVRTTADQLRGCLDATQRNLAVEVHRA